MEGSSLKRKTFGTSLEVQWLRLHASTEEDTAQSLVGGTKIPHAAQRSQKNKHTKIKQKTHSWMIMISNELFKETNMTRYFLHL